MGMVPGAPRRNKQCCCYNMPNTLVKIRWNPPGGKTGLFSVKDGPLASSAAWQGADYLLILKCQGYDELIEIIRSVDLTIIKPKIHTFNLDDSTLALLLLHC